MISEGFITSNFAVEPGIEPGLVIAIEAGTCTRKASFFTVLSTSSQPLPFSAQQTRPSCRISILPRMPTG